MTDTPIYKKHMLGLYYAIGFELARALCACVGDPDGYVTLESSLCVRDTTHEHNFQCIYDHVCNLHGKIGICSFSEQNHLNDRHNIVG